jgi:hypothetical protein
MWQQIPTISVASSDFQLVTGDHKLFRAKAENPVTGRGQVGKRGLNLSWALNLQDLSQSA